MADTRLQVILEAQDKASGTITKFETTLGKVRDGLKKYTAVIAGGVTAMGGMIYAAKKLIDEYGKEERAHARLTAGLLNVKGMTDANVESLKRYASELQRTTTFADEQIVSSMGLLSTFQLNEKAIRALQPRILDMAAALEKATGQQQDLESISIAVGKAMTMGVGALTRYGVVVSEQAKAQWELASAEEKVNILTRELDNNFKGVAETVAKTTTGQMKQLDNAISDIRETIGGAIAEAIMPYVGKIKDWALDQGNLNKILETTKITIDTIIGSIKTLYSIATLPGKAIGSVLGKIEEWKSAARIREMKGEKMWWEKLLGFQQGGIVPGPIGKPIPAIVHGGETIIPADKKVGNTYNFNFAGAFIGDKESLIREIKRAINRESELKALAGA